MLTTSSLNCVSFLVIFLTIFFFFLVPDDWEVEKLLLLSDAEFSVENYFKNYFRGTTYFKNRFRGKKTISKTILHVFTTTSFSLYVPVFL